MSDPTGAEPRISVLVCTIDHPKELDGCVQSILKNEVEDFELLVIDQSRGDETQELMTRIDDPRFRYIRTPTKGLSRGRNIGIQASRAPLILFTDDDCFAEPTWVREVLREFEEHPQIDALYGMVRPWGTAPEEKGWICPTIIEDEEARTVKKLKASTHEALGHGNNMAFRRSCFIRLGLYQDWLGAGTPMKGGEDTDFTFRLLFHGAEVRYSPKPITYHDNWMTDEQSLAQLKGYKKSGAVVFCRFFLRGSWAAFKVLCHFWKSHWKDYRGSVKWKNKEGAAVHKRMLLYHTWGVILGVVFVFRRARPYKVGDKTYPWTEYPRP